MDDKIRIDRVKLYPVGRGNYRMAWKWSYTAHIPGERYNWQYGPGLASLLDQIKRKYPQAQIVKSWEVTDHG